MSKIQNKWLSEAPGQTLKGNNNVGSGPVKDLTAAQVSEMLSIALSERRYLPLVETPGVCQPAGCEDWPEMVMEYNENGRLDIVSALEI